MDYGDDLSSGAGQNAAAAPVVQQKRKRQEVHISEYVSYKTYTNLINCYKIFNFHILC